MSDIASNLSEIRERIARAAEDVGRKPGEVTLIAASKTVAPERIIEAIEAGVTHFGENRVQEARAKFASYLNSDDRGDAGPLAEGLVPREGITLHMIGALQRNKARRAAGLFDWVQSVDRVDLAQTMDESAGPPEREWTWPVLLEVNLTGEPGRSGIAPAELPGLADALSSCEHLSGRGLMTIARQGAGEAELRRTFAALRDMLERLRDTYGPAWAHLSMGMSEDYEPAVREGATMLRLGRAIFGERDPR